MKTKPPITQGIALGGPYCGERFRSAIELVLVPPGAYLQTAERDSQGCTLYRWEHQFPPAPRKSTP